MAFDQYRSNWNEAQMNRVRWMLRNIPEELMKKVVAGENLGLGANQRHPLRNIDGAGFPIYFDPATETVFKMVAAEYKKFYGILYTPQKIGMACMAVPGGGKALLPVGSTPVVAGNMVMCDPAPAYGDVGTDVVRQFSRKTISIRHPKTAAGAVDQPGTPPAPAAIDTFTYFDGLGVNYGWQPGDTIQNSTVGVSRVIKTITYTAAAEGYIVWDAVIGAGWADGDVLTSAHASNEYIHVDPNEDLFGNIKALKAARLIDESIPDVDNLVVVTGVPGAGEIRLIGNNAFQIHTAVEEGDALILDVEFYDDEIHKWTVGKAVTGAAARTAAGTAGEENASVDLV